VPIGGKSNRRTAPPTFDCVHTFLFVNTVKGGRELAPDEALAIIQ